MTRKAVIDLDGCCVRFPLFSSTEYNLKRRLFSLTNSKPNARQYIDALIDVSLSIHDGERVALIGQNGAGKTTFLRVISGVLYPTQGKSYINSSEVTLIGSMGPTLDPELSGVENIFDLALLHSRSAAWARSNIDQIVDISGLGKRISDPVRTYSTGMAVRLKTSFSLALRPQILLVDEAIGTADHQFLAKIQNKISQLIDYGSVAVIASHNLDFLQRHCSRAVIFDKGRVAFDGAIEDAISQHVNISAKP